MALRLGETPEQQAGMQAAEQAAEECGHKLWWEAERGALTGVCKRGEDGCGFEVVVTGAGQWTPNRFWRGTAHGSRHLCPRWDPDVEPIWLRWAY